MDKNQPVKTLPKPKPNLVTKPQGDGVNKDKQRIKGKHIKTVKHLDQLFSKDFRF